MPSGRGKRGGGASAAKREGPLEKLVGPANALTAVRILLTVAVLVLWLSEIVWLQVIALVLYVIAAVTDLLDGLVARHYDSASSFGAFLDPVADKLLVIVGSVAVLDVFHGAWWVQLPVAIILMRELVVVAMREWASRAGVADALAVVAAGKVKTVLQLVALGMLMGTVWPDVWARPLVLYGGVACLWAALIATLFSFSFYFNAFLRLMRQQEDS